MTEKERKRKLMSKVMNVTLFRTYHDLRIYDTVILCSCVAKIYLLFYFINITNRIRFRQWSNNYFCNSLRANKIIVILHFLFFVYNSTKILWNFLVEIFILCENNSFYFSKLVKIGHRNWRKLDVDQYPGINLYEIYFLTDKICYRLSWQYYLYLNTAFEY